MRRRILSVLISMTLLAVTLTPLPAASVVISRLECAPYLIIGLRGSAQAMDGSLGMSGVAGRYAEEALKSLPADRTKTYSLPYPAWPVSLAGFPPSVHEGQWILTIAVRRLVRMCPGINIGLIGYSQGAMVINKALPMLAAEERKAVRAVLLLSDPNSAGDTSYDAPIQVGGTPGAHTGGGILGKVSLPADVQSRSTDLCIDGDPVCDAPEEKSLSFIIAAGLFLFDIHTKLYPGCCGGLPIAGPMGMAFAQRLMQSPATPPVLGPMPALPEGFCPSLVPGAARGAAAPISQPRTSAPALAWTADPVSGCGSSVLS